MVIKSIANCLVEDSRPIHMKAETQVAPQELYRPAKGPLQAASEMTPTDKRRMRRRLKAVRRSQAAQREERIRTQARLDPRRQSVLDRREALKTLARTKNVTILPSKQRQGRQKEPGDRRQK